MGVQGSGQGKQGTRYDALGTRGESSVCVTQDNIPRVVVRELWHEGTRMIIRYERARAGESGPLLVGEYPNQVPFKLVGYLEDKGTMQ